MKKVIFILLLLTACSVQNIKEIPSENGTIEVYFCPRDNCSAVLENLVLQSKKVDCAVFELNLPNVINALEKTESRIVVDQTNYDEVYYLPFAKTNKKGQLMHNKFCIFDNSIITTGSFNPTERCAYFNNNNLLVIKSKILVDNYNKEFNELWLGEFGKGAETKNTKFYFNGYLVENYFCPEDWCANKIIKELNKANQSVYFMTFSFTHEMIGDVLVNLHEKGLDVKGVFEKSQKNNWTQYDKLISNGMAVKWDNNKYNMHHKVFIIDNEIVITGSFNPSLNADLANDENILIIHNKAIAELYLKEFDIVYQ